MNISLDLTLLYEAGPIYIPFSSINYFIKRGFFDTNRNAC